jgi:hypothetical protein
MWVCTKMPAPFSCSGSSMLQVAATGFSKRGGLLSLIVQLLLGLRSHSHVPQGDVPWSAVKGRSYSST